MANAEQMVHPPARELSVCLRMRTPERRSPSYLDGEGTARSCSRPSESAWIDKGVSLKDHTGKPDQGKLESEAARYAKSLVETRCHLTGHNVNSTADVLADCLNPRSAVRGRPCS